MDAVAQTSSSRSAYAEGLGLGVAAREKMNYLEFIARVTSHIPDKGQVEESGKYF